MRRIGLLSDTHNHLDKTIFDHFADVDEIWHAGDIGNIEIADQLQKFKPFKAVYGNIDGTEVRKQYSEDLWWDCEGFQIWMTHIGGYPGKYASRVRNILQVRQPNIFICGHSHILKVMRDQQYGFYMLNPGACGIEGFHPIKTLLKFDLDDKRMLNMQAIELGKRSQLH